MRFSLRFLLALLLGAALVMSRSAEAHRYRSLLASATSTSQSTTTAQTGADGEGEREGCGVRTYVCLHVSDLFPCVLRLGTASATTTQQTTANTQGNAVAGSSAAGQGSAQGSTPAGATKVDISGASQSVAQSNNDQSNASAAGQQTTSGVSQIQTALVNGTLMATPLTTVTSNGASAATANGNSSASAAQTAGVANALAMLSGLLPSTTGSPISQSSTQTGTQAAAALPGTPAINLAPITAAPAPSPAPTAAPTAVSTQSLPATPQQPQQVPLVWWYPVTNSNSAVPATTTTQSVATPQSAVSSASAPATPSAPTAVSGVQSADPAATCAALPQDLLSLVAAAGSTSKLQLCYALCQQNYAA